VLDEGQIVDSSWMNHRRPCERVRVPTLCCGSGASLLDAEPFQLGVHEVDVAEQSLKYLCVVMRNAMRDGPLGFQRILS